MGDKMPVPKGSKTKRCSMQRGIFRSDPEYGKKWVEEFGDQCKGVSMAKTKKVRKKTQSSKKVLYAR